MFIKYTYQDWLNTPITKRTELLEKIISAYKASDDFRAAATADGYYSGEKTAIDEKVIMKPQEVTCTDANGKTKKTVSFRAVIGNRINTDFFRRSIVERTHYSLANGIIIDGKPSEESLGIGADHAISEACQNAQVDGCCWLYWNHDHIEVIPAYDDALSGFVALVDERTSQPMVGIRFWQLDSDRPMWVQLYELDGMTEYSRPKDAEHLQEYAHKQPYSRTGFRDAAGEVVTDTSNYPALPIVPLYANSLHRSSLTKAIKRKLDAYDVIVSDFGDNLEQANQIYWVLNNFGGGLSEVADMLHKINELRVIANISDGTGGSSVDAKSYEVPHAARALALSLLEASLHDDAMIVNRKEINGGSLTNVAIETAYTKMDLGADELEWEVFAAVQQLLALTGKTTEEITFKRSKLYNVSETVQTIYTMRSDIDQRTALTLNPMLAADEIDQIMQATAQEAAAKREMESIAAEVINQFPKEDTADEDASV